MECFASFRIIEKQIMNSQDPKTQNPSLTTSDGELRNPRSLPATHIVWDSKVKRASQKRRSSRREAYYEAQLKFKVIFWITLVVALLLFACIQLLR
jgi:hypothetical protein